MEFFLTRFSLTKVKFNYVGKYFTLKLFLNIFKEFEILLFFSLCLLHYPSMGSNGLVVREILKNCQVSLIQSYLKPIKGELPV